MLRNTSLTVALMAFSVLAVAEVRGQALKPSVITGDVASVAEAKIVVNAKGGPINAVISTATAFKRVPPDNPNLSAAVASNISEIGVGDKVMITGVIAADGKSVPARAVYLMTKSDLSQKTAKDAEAWRTRGISGKVVTVNTQTRHIIVESGGMNAKTSVTLTPKSEAKFLRYAAESVKFADAKASSLADIKAGDELRALGEKSSDGTAFSADTILSGGFRQSAGTIKSVDVANKQVVITDLGTKKEVTIAFADAVLMKRFPAEMADRMAAMQAGGGAAGGVQAVRPVGGGRPPEGTPAAGAGSGGPRPMGGGRPGGGFAEMIDRLPNMTAEELKVGESIAVLTSSSAAGADHVRAIKLVAGVDPFIKMAQMSPGAGRPRPGGGRGVDFNIPGLDGVGP